jgi:hypothetical protein
MFITVISTTNYNEKCKLDTWSKQTQTKPISKGKLTIKENGVVLLRNDSVVLNRTGEFSVKPILKISEIGRVQPPPSL